MEYVDNIGQFQIGRVVKLSGSYHGSAGIAAGSWIGEDVIGHVIGFSVNVVGEVVLKITWANGNSSVCHPNNVTVL